MIMSQQERRMKRHEKEQKRKFKKADEALQKAKKEARKAGSLYGFDSEAYKKAKAKRDAAYTNYFVAKEKGATSYTSIKGKRARAASPAGKMRIRQEREFITEKDVEPYRPQGRQSGGMIGASDMSAKKTSAPKKKKMPQYYMGGGMIKKNKPYAYGGRVAKYKE
tara:strand:+ start:246 stop:740 length:495 start_codon:yes stop_codon:yes gene_type:complete